MPNMSDPKLETFLSDYIAPVDDDGFSDAFMARLKERQAPEIDWGQPEQDDLFQAWRRWILAFTLGGTAGFAAVKMTPLIHDVQSSASIPDMGWSGDMPTMTAYIAIALVMTVGCLFADGTLSS